MANEMQVDSQAKSTSNSNRRSKVSRVIAERGLDGFGSELEDLWAGTENAQCSLRELADYFNQHVLQSAMRAVGGDPLVGEAENLHKLLTDDEVTSGTKIRAEHRLERIGIDVDRLQSDFVSHQAIHTYLTKYREVEPPMSNGEAKIEKSQNTIQQLRSRLQAVTETTITTLVKTNELSRGDYQVHVNINVMCTACQTQYSVTELFDSGGCKCG